MSDWIKHYRTNKHVVWIKCKCSDQSEHFFHDMKDWVSLVSHTSKQSTHLSELALQFRSHEEKLDLTEAEGIYLITSAMCSMGGASKNYLTFGKVNGNSVKKQMWIIPELIVEKEYDDTIDNCFEEAIIDVRKKKKNGEE